ncbi:B12-binding domain-containing radical SAM protein [bacterium]|nr:B12-binding domain-containing radical SAM protein [candidate division CSSED10-310 bacterium]
MANVLFLQDLAYEYFGTMHLSAYLKQHGHQCMVFIDHLEHDVVRKVLDANPDLIAFSCLTPTVKWALQAARRVKSEKNIPIIFGGNHVTLNPEDLFQNDVADFVCIGEGEQPLVELCDALDRGEHPTAIENLWIKADGKEYRNPLRPLVVDLDTLPFADREMYDRYPFFKSRKVKAMLLGRGCPYKCNYCHNHAKMRLFSGLGKYVRFRSIEHVLAEIDELIGTYRFEFLHFVDDAFGTNKKWLREFLPQLATRGVQYVGSLRANNLDDEMCALMKATGLQSMSFAVETGEERFRTGFLKKNVTDRHLLRAARMLRMHKIPFLTMNMVGLPTETLEQSLHTLHLNIRLKPVYACCYLFQPYPNTELYEYLVSHRLFDPASIKDMGFLSYDLSIVANPAIKEQRNIQRLFALTVMFPRLFPLTSRIIKAPPNLLFDGIFYALYTYYLKRYFRLTPRIIFYNILFWIKFNLLKKSST